MLQTAYHETTLLRGFENDVQIKAVHSLAMTIAMDVANFNGKTEGADMVYWDEKDTAEDSELFSKVAIQIKRLGSICRNSDAAPYIHIVSGSLQLRVMPKNGDYSLFEVIEVFV